VPRVHRSRQHSFPQPLSEDEAENYCKSFGSQLKTVLEQGDLKRTPVAHNAGISKKHLADIVEQGANPSLKVMAKLMHTLDIDTISFKDGRIRFGSPNPDVNAAIKTLLASADRLRELRGEGSMGMAKDQGNPDDAAPVSSVATRTIELRDGAPRGGETTLNAASGVQSPLGVSRHEPKSLRVPVAGRLAGGMLLPVTGSEQVMLPADASGVFEIDVYDETFAYANLAKGDRLMVEAGVEPRENDLVIASADDRPVIGRYRTDDGGPRVVTGTSEKDVRLGDGNGVRLFGVVRYIVRVP
jgi:hypothetical protein